MLMLTANRLEDGRAVWFAGEDRWSQLFTDGHVAADPDAVAVLEAARARFAGKGQLVDLQLIDLIEEEGEVRPRRLREVIRAGGPTVRIDAPDRERALFERAA